MSTPSNPQIRRSYLKSFLSEFASPATISALLDDLQNAESINPSDPIDKDLAADIKMLEKELSHLTGHG